MSGKSTSGSTSGTIPARGELRACSYMSILIIYGIITYVNYAGLLCRYDTIVSMMIPVLPVIIYEFCLCVVRDTKLFCLMS